MILNTPDALSQFLKTTPPVKSMPFSRILMVSPEHYRIEYAINPYMTEEGGELKIVDPKKAKAQWTELKSCYERLGYPVDVLIPDPSLPDMVFAANQSFPFFHGNKEKILLSQMKTPQRKPEVSHFEKFFKSKGIETFSLSDTAICFEGNGDAILDPVFPLVWGAVGPRSDRKAYEEISSRFELNVVTLNLISEDFYHLDTCFNILNPTTAIIQPEAFSAEDIAKFKMRFSTIIEVEYLENFEFFCANCHCPDGKNVITQSGSRYFRHQLKEVGLTVHEVDTSEFIKGGGSVFCLKMFY